MDKFFQVDILSADKTLYSGKASSLVAPAGLGYLGILADHAPMITTLSPGRISLKEESGKQVVINCKGKGFLEVFKNNISLLLDEVG